MKTIFLLFTFLIPFFPTAQDDVFGVWKAIDDADGQATSHIQVFEQDGRLHGKIVKLLEESYDIICSHCEGDKKGQPILGMEIIWDMEKKGEVWKGGRILDPERGKNYKCRIRLVDGVLEVRGYVGMPALGRTQKWYPVKS